MNDFRNVWCKRLRPSDLAGMAPASYRNAKDGEDRKPGLYGAGAVGEALVCLLPEDSGDWFKAAAMGCAGGHGCRHEATT